MDRWKLLLVATLAFILAACGTAANAEPAPPDIHYGEDVCEFCGMIASEERFAAAYLTADGHHHVFDDIGDLVKSHLQLQEDVTAFFVHDHDDKSWIRAETATFVLSEDLATPMLSGLAAFATEAAAQAFATEIGGRTFAFETLLTYYQENPPTPAFSGTR